MARSPISGAASGGRPICAAPFGRRI